MDRTKCNEFHQRACEVIPGGVHSSARKHISKMNWGKAKGAYLWDLDGNKYIDYHGSWSAVVLGYQHEYIVEKVSEAVKTYDLYGSGVTEPEVKLAEKICEHVPSAEKVLFTTSGSAATYNSIRLCRAVTGKTKIIKFEGTYHGWHDYVLMNNVSKEGTTYKNNPESKGMLSETVKNTLICRINDIENVKKTIEDSNNDVAAIILEPIAHNMGSVIFKKEFLQELRSICDQKGIILIFDEVITGFRSGLGGYQKICGVTPDLTTLGKAVANGYPIAAIAGKSELMDRFATNPSGDVAFGGTYNGSPISAAAGVATIEMLEQEGVYEHIFSLGDRMRNGLKQVADSLSIDVNVAGFGSVFVVYWGAGDMDCYEDIFKMSAEKSLAFRKNMIDRGHFLLPMSHKRAVISHSHTTDDIDQTLEAAERAMKELRGH